MGWSGGSGVGRGSIHEVGVGFAEVVPVNVWLCDVPARIFTMTFVLVPFSLQSLFLGLLELPLAGWPEVGNIGRTIVLQATPSMGVSSVRNPCSPCGSCLPCGPSLK